MSALISRKREGWELGLTLTKSTKWRIRQEKMKTLKKDFKDFFSFFP